MDKLRETMKSMSAAKEASGILEASKEAVMRPLTESPRVLEVPQPTLSKHPPKKKKKPKKPKAKKKKANDTS